MGPGDGALMGSGGLLLSPGAEAEFSQRPCPSLAGATLEIRRMAQAQGAVAASVRAITNREVTGEVQSLDELTRAIEPRA